MKYIRTKDGRIVDLERYRIANNTGMPYIQFYDKEKKIDFELLRQDFETFKQADTIEELCDEFVYVGNEAEPFIADIEIDSKLLKAINNSIKEHKVKDELYGAIWTDKGLIYVAKMNEKGELELL